ncbi:MAG: hypothetical protein L6Q77_12800 [Bacteroidetes bacterium]|nr:hypothetical protein [Bacteroidota bacterium]
MRNRIRMVVLVAAGIQFLALSAVLGQKADLTAQWEVAKKAASALGIETGAMPGNAMGFQADTVDSDTFRELKQTFEQDGSIKAVFLVEKGATWVFHRYNRWWWPAVWGGMFPAILVPLGVLNDVPAATISGAVLGVGGAVIGYFTMEKAEVIDFKNDNKGTAAVFILKK